MHFLLSSLPLHYSCLSSSGQYMQASSQYGIKNLLYYFYLCKLADQLLNQQYLIDRELCLQRLEWTLQSDHTK